MRPVTDETTFFISLSPEGVRGDDVSLAEQGMTRGSTGSLEYHDDPEEIREEGGDEAYLVTAGEPEPVPEVGRHIFGFYLSLYSGGIQTRDL